MDEMYNNQTSNMNNSNGEPITPDEAAEIETVESAEAPAEAEAPIEAEAADEQPNPYGSYTYQSPVYRAEQSQFGSARPQYQGYQSQGSYTYQSSQSAQPSYQAPSAQAQAAPLFATAQPKNEKNHKFSFLTLVLSVVVAVMLSGVLSTGICLYLMSSDLVSNRTQSSADASTNANGFTGNANTTITNNTDNFVEAVAAKVQPSVVGIRTVYKYYSQNLFGGSSENEAGNEGSGVIYTSDGYIITNKHVVEKAITYNGDIYVYLGGKLDTPYTATVIGYDSSVDLAVIKIDETNLPAAEIGKSSDLKIGQNAVAVGCPGGLEFMGSVSVGYISGLNRKLAVDSVTMSLIQTDTAINPGNSGGALVDNEGKLIGITNAKLVDEEFEGMGFAIPVDTVTEICDGIIAGKDEPKPYIGVNINRSYTAEILERYGMPAGAVVNSVIEGGPAEKAGIRRADIIVSVGDHNVTSYDTLVSAINKYKVGDTVNIRVYRNGKYYNCDVTLTANG